jgi:hypothetical protein
MSCNILFKNATLFWQWLKSTINSHEDDISYGFKLEQQYEKYLIKKLND